LAPPGLLENFSDSKKETDPCLIPGEKSSKSSCLQQLFQRHFVRPNFFRKKVSGTPLKLDHGLLTYELPEVLGENLALCSMILLLQSNTIKSIAPQQQIQMQTILTPNIFEVNTINTTIPLL